MTCCVCVLIEPEAEDTGTFTTVSILFSHQKKCFKVFKTLMCVSSDAATEETPAGDLIKHKPLHKQQP